jgi:hypothetical protein
MAACAVNDATAEDAADEARQLAGIAALIRISRMQQVDNVPTRPIPVISNAPAR